MLVIGGVVKVGVGAVGAEVLHPEPEEGTGEAPRGGLTVDQYAFFGW